MDDYGIIISQKGYDATDCADRFLAYSSAFEGLKIFLKTQVTISGWNAATITHNFGYYAPFVVFKADGSIFKDVRQYTDRLEINHDGDFQSGVLTVFLFANDFSEVAGVNISTGTEVGATSNNYGIRVSKEGYDAKTCEDDQLMFSSSFFTNIIHQKGSFRPGPDNGSGAADAPGSVAHNLGYVPDFFLYKKNDFDTYMKMFFPEGDNSIADISTTVLRGGQIYDLSLSWYYLNQTFYYVIFKNRLS